MRKEAERKELRIKQEKLLKKYGFTSLEEYISWLYRCDWWPLCDLWYTSQLPSRAYVPDDIIPCVSLRSFKSIANFTPLTFFDFDNYEECWKIQKISSDNNTFSYIFLCYNKDRTQIKDSFVLITKKNLDDLLKEEAIERQGVKKMTACLKFIGKRQYGLPISFIESLTSNLVERNISLDCNTYEVLTFCNIKNAPSDIDIYFKKLKEFYDCGMLDLDFIGEEYKSSEIDNVISHHKYRVRCFFDPEINGIYEKFYGQD